jgi:Tol biopolymer transport system component
MTPTVSGEFANPARLQTPVAPTVYFVNTEMGEQHKIEEGASPSFAPDGKSFAFISHGQIFAASIDSLKASKLFQSRGEQNSIRWSPDSKKIAFVSNRGSYSFIGIYDIASKTIQYPDAGVDNDIEPVWSRDGKQLAYIRCSNLRNAIPFVPQLAESGPGAYAQLNITTGESREIWKATTGTGSALWTDIPAMQNFLLWSANDSDCLSV